MELIVNGEAKIFDHCTHLSDLVLALDLEHKRIVIELNEHIIFAPEYPRCKLKPGDKIEIVQAVGGGQ